MQGKGFVLIFTGEFVIFKESYKNIDREQSYLFFTGLYYVLNQP